MQEQKHATKQWQRKPKSEPEHKQEKRSNYIARNNKKWHISKRKLSHKRTKQKHARKRLYNENQPRQTTISTQPGLRALSVISINPDNLISTERRTDIIRELQKKKRIRIAAISETQIPHGLEFLRDGYKIITSAARKNEARYENNGECPKAE